MTQYGRYFDNVNKELSILWSKHLKQIVEWHKTHPRKKMPMSVKKHKKLIELCWKSSGRWKKESRF